MTSKYFFNQKHIFVIFLKLKPLKHYKRISNACVMSLTRVPQRVPDYHFKVPFEAFLDPVRTIVTTSDYKSNLFIFSCISAEDQLIKATEAHKYILTKSFPLRITIRSFFALILMIKDTSFMFSIF